MFPGKAVRRFLKTPCTDFVSESSDTTPISSEPAVGDTVFALDRDRRLVSASTSGSKPQFVDRASLARTCVAANESFRPETRARPVWQSPHIAEIPMSSDLARHAAAKILHAQGRHAQALEIATAVLASQKARLSNDPKQPDPMQPGIAATRALVAEIRHALRCAKRGGAS